MRHFLLIFCFTFVTSVAFSEPRLIRQSQIKPIMAEMLSMHVEHHEMDETLTARSFTIFLEQFDAEKIYLLKSEALQFVEMTPARARQALQEYKSNNFSSYLSLNCVIEKSILRARKIRQEIERELIVAAKKIPITPKETFIHFSTDPSQLRSRIRQFLEFILFIEQKNRPELVWDQFTVEKVFALWEKRLSKLEDPYLTVKSSAITEHNFTTHTLKALAKSLDSHSAFFTPQEAFELRALLEKQFEGVGLVLREGINGVEIVDLIPGGPAINSGSIEKGDELVAIDGKQIGELSYDEVLSLLQGDGKNKGITLSVRRQNQVMHVELKREKIIMKEERVQVQSVPFADGFIGKVTLPAFYESSSSSSEKDLKEALLKLKRQGKLYGLVIDLRENTGGFLSQAVKIGGMFITGGVVVISKYAGDQIQYLRHMDGRVAYTGPLILLTSKCSASAAEIVAQALQDYGTALVAGDKRTYGKGSIQYQTLTDPTAVTFYKVTIGKYYTVSGRSTQNTGVIADLVIPTLYAPLKIGEKYLPFSLPSDHVAPAFIDPLSDVDLKSKLWLEKNYLPKIQQPVKVWQDMLPKLRDNLQKRIQNDPNFQLFLGYLEDPALNGNLKKIGQEDIQMQQAVEVVRDMIQLSQN